MGYSDPEFLKEFAAWLVVLRKRFQMTQAERSEERRVGKECSC